jgi:hypothetical protein
LDPSFEAFAIDEVLSRLEDPKKYPGFTDPRHCLVFWARPTPNVKKLAAVVQDKLKAAFPGTRTPHQHRMSGCQDADAKI